MRRLCAVVLALQAVVTALAIPVAIAIDGANPATAGITGGVLAVVGIVIAGLLRHRWAYAAGTVLQLLVIATGFVVTPMFFLGFIFGALWLTAIWVGRRTESVQPR